MSLPLTGAGSQASGASPPPGSSLIFTGTANPHASLWTATGSTLTQIGNKVYVNSPSTLTALNTNGQALAGVADFSNSDFASVTSLNMSGGVGMTSLVIGNAAAASLTTLNLSDNAIATQSVVNAIFTQLYTYGLGNAGAMTVNLTGGTNAFPPTGTALTDAYALQAAGATITGLFQPSDLGADLALLIDLSAGAAKQSGGSPCTADGQTIVTLADSSGNGNNLIQYASSVMRYTLAGGLAWADATNVGVFVGLNNNLASAAVIAAPMEIWVALETTGSGQTSVFPLFNGKYSFGGADSSCLFIDANGNWSTAATPSGTAVPTSMPVAVNVPNRIGWSTDATTGKVYINNPMATVSGPTNQSPVGGSPSDGVSGIWLASDPAGLNWIGRVRKIVGVSRLLTQTERNGLFGWLGSPVPTYQLFAQGNSLTFGFGLAAYQAWPNQIQGLLNTAGSCYGIINDGIDGETTPEMTTAAPTAVDPYINTTAFTRNILVGWEIINDIASGSTGTQAYDNYKTYGAARIAAGWTLILIDCIDGQPTSGSWTQPQIETQRAACNAALAADFSVATANPYIWLPGAGVTYATMLFRASAMSQFSDATNTTYYQSDKLHLTTAGQLLIAEGVQTGISLLP